jgi:tRNA A-37 threonylcarbamoyl transferase component Bud32
MSATIHDALSDVPGKLLRLDAPAPEDPDPHPTADIADEATSELGPPPRPTAAAPVSLVVPGAAPGMAPVASGSVLRERYVLEAPLASGGTATVYRAVDLRREAALPEGRRVAVKLLRPEFRDRPVNVARLQREFRQTQAVAHPNVVRFHDLDCDRGTWFIVMELLTGETLGRALRRAGPAGLAQAEALRVAIAVGEALEHAHAHGVIHGDVKPANVFLTESGEVRLLDFGVAPESGSTAAPGPAESGTAAATRAYASPEVLAGLHAQGRDDVFSLACVTYEMLAGAHPSGRRGPGSAHQSGHVPEPVAGLDRARWQMLAAALDAARANRPDMDAFVRALRGPAAATAPALPEASVPPLLTPVASAPSAPSAAPAAAPRRLRLVVGVAGAAGLALVLGILIGRLDSTADGPPAATAPAIVVEPEARPVALALERPAAPEPDPPPAADVAGPVAADTLAPAAGPPGLVTFDAPTMVVSSRAVVAAIPLRHLSRVPRDVSVNWRLIDGTARAGRDYGGPTEGTERLVEGNSFRILYVPILRDPTARRDRTFTVELTGATPGSEVGGAPRVEVTILGDA